MDIITASQFPTLQPGKLDPEFVCLQEFYENMIANTFVPTSAGVPGQDGANGKDYRTEVESFRECFAIPEDGSPFVWAAPNEYAANTVVTWFLNNAPGIAESTNTSNGVTTITFSSTTGNPIEVQPGSEICHFYQLTRTGFDNDGDGKIDEVLSGPPADIIGNNN